MSSSDILVRGWCDELQGKFRNIQRPKSNLKFPLELTCLHTQLKCKIRRSVFSECKLKSIPLCSFQNYRRPISVLILCFSRWDLLRYIRRHSRNFPRTWLCSVSFVLYSSTECFWGQFVQPGRSFRWHYLQHCLNRAPTRLWEICQKPNCDRLKRVPELRIWFGFVVNCWTNCCLRDLFPWQILWERLDGRCARMWLNAESSFSVFYC